MAAYKNYTLELHVLNDADMNCVSLFWYKFFLTFLFIMLAFYCRINTFQAFPFEIDITEKVSDQLVLFSRQTLKPMWLLLHSSVSWRSLPHWKLIYVVTWCFLTFDQGQFHATLFFFFFWATEKFKWKLAVIIHHNGATCRGAMHRFPSANTA